MKISRIMHISDKKSNKSLVPMMIVSDTPKEVATAVVQTSDECAGINTDFKIEQQSSLVLDPGGMFFGKTPFIKFEIENIPCEIQGTKIEATLEEMKYSKECYPGITRFRMWYLVYIMPTIFFESLRSKLIELNKSDDVLHAQITEDEIKAKIEKECQHVVFKMPREI